MATIQHDYISCCGLREINSLSENGDAKSAMLDLVNEIYGPIAPKVKKVNPYKRPKGVEWKRGTFGERYWVNASGEHIYEYMAEDWEYDNNPLYDDDSYDARWRYAVFTQAGKGQSYGRKFAALIRKEKLGEVVQATTKTVKNPNSGNILKAWMWTVNHKNLKAWAQKQADAQVKAKGAK